MTEKITVFVHSSIRVGTSVGNVYIDPFKMTGEPHDAAIVLVTHEHYDHFSPEDIRKVIKADTVLVVPESMAGKAREAALVKHVETVAPGGKYTIAGLAIETVASYNPNKPFHPKAAAWVGYIIDDGRRVYIMGDTDATEEAKKVRCDIVLVPVGGKYTMDAEEAAEYVNTIRPQIAIPVHYGKVAGGADAGELFASKVDAGITVDRQL